MKKEKDNPVMNTQEAEDSKKAKQVILQAINKATKAGVYDLQEASSILFALTTLKIG